MKLRVKNYKFIPDDINSCIDSLVIQILKSYQINVWGAFNKSYQVTIDNNNTGYISNFSTHNGLAESQLKKKMGLKRINLSFSKTEVTDLLKQQIAVFMLADTYYCKFDVTSYLKRHTPHYILLKANKDNSFTAYDNHFAYNGSSVSSSELDNMGKKYNSCFYFRINNLKSTKFDSYSLKAVNEHIKNNKLLLNTLLKYVKNYKYIDNDFLQFIFDMAQGKMQFSLFLKEKGYYKSSNEYKNLYDEWNTIFGMLLKLRVMNKNVNFLQRIGDKISQAINNENNLLSTLTTTENNIDKMNNAIIRSIDVHSDNLQYLPINISRIFQNKAFYNSKMKAAFSAYQSFYYLPNNKKIEEVSKKYNVSNWAKETNDNLLCKGQKFKISHDISGKYLAILGTGELISQKGVMKLVNKSNRTFEYEIGLSKWNNTMIPSFEEKILYTGKLGVYIDDKPVVRKDLGNLYEYFIDISNVGSIEQIVFPLNPNIHIFGISVVNYMEE